MGASLRLFKEKRQYRADRYLPIVFLHDFLTKMFGFISFQLKFRIFLFLKMRKSKTNFDFASIFYHQCKLFLTQEYIMFNIETMLV